jgi:hypothetical protein
MLHPITPTRRDWSFFARYPLQMWSEVGACTLRSYADPSNHLLIARLVCMVCKCGDVADDAERETSHSLCRAGSVTATSVLSTYYRATLIITATAFCCYCCYDDQACTSYIDHVRRHLPFSPTHPLLHLCSQETLDNFLSLYDTL